MAAVLCRLSLPLCSGECVERRARYTACTFVRVRLCRICAMRPVRKRHLTQSARNHLCQRPECSEVTVQRSLASLSAQYLETVVEIHREKNKLKAMMQLNDFGVKKVKRRTCVFVFNYVEEKIMDAVWREEI